MSTDHGLHRVALSGSTMGTRYSCVFYAPSAGGHEALANRLSDAVTHVDLVMSNWKPESVLSRLNDVSPGQWVDVPESLMTVLAAALRIEAQSNGAFDIGVALEVADWGFGPHASKTPGASLDRKPREATYANLELDRTNSQVRKHAPLALDLSGIAKGYGVDCLGEVLTKAGIASWLVGIDGEMRGKGLKPDGSPWAVGHERPVPGQREIMGVIELTDLAVATSGAYRQFHDAGGRTVSHTIDPRTGQPIEGKLRSATVLAGTCMEADAWATAILVDGHWPPKGFPMPIGVEAILAN